MLKIYKVFSYRNSVVQVVRYMTTTRSKCLTFSRSISRKSYPKARKPPLSYCKCHAPPPDCCWPRPIPANPCVPVFHKMDGSWRKYKYFAIFVCLPLILWRSIESLSHEQKPVTECRDYEFMRIRRKKFPWGDGVKTFFHNDHVNKLPGECKPPESPCGPKQEPYKELPAPVCPPY